MGKFKIPATPPTTNKTIRFPNDVVEEVEKAIQGKNCTFSPHGQGQSIPSLSQTAADSSCGERHAKPNAPVFSEDES